MISQVLIKKLQSELSQLADTLYQIAVGEEIENSHVKKESKKDGETENKKVDTKINIEDIRAVLAKKSQAGLTSKVKELLESFGAAKLSAIKPEDYENLLVKAREL